ncbi:MAG: flagellin [Pseudobdellovibrio sp.]
MGLRINTNTAGLNAQFQLRNNTKGVSNAMERLSSGNRINRSSDDAAGMAISENMRANIRNLKQADRNAQDAVSLTQVAEGSLTQIANTLVRLRELAMQAASDTVADDQRILIGREYNQMLEEIDRIASVTEYNGTKLLLGTGDRIDFQINTRNSDGVDRISFDPTQADMTTTSLGIEHSGVNDKLLAQDSLSMLDGAINNVSELRATFGSIQSRLITTTENIISNLESVSAANSRIRDADIAEESSELAKKNLMLQSGTAILAQANQQPGQALSLLNKG